MELLRTRLRITDINALLDFFCNKLGLVEVGRRELEQGRFTLICLAALEEAARARENDAPLLELIWSRDSGEADSGREFGRIAY